MQKESSFWISLRSSLWFIPGIMISASIILALVLVEIDAYIGSDWQTNYPRLFGLGADGSRGMLTAIASSMLTVAALVFSLTLSIISQASGQYTPRILRNFMRDRINQFILGYFVSVFAFCLLILRTIRGGDEIKFVPSLGVITGLILALGGIIVLIYFIHHIANSLQISHIVRQIAEETVAAIKRVFPDEIGTEDEDNEHQAAEKIQKIKNWRKIPSLSSGYIQLVDEDELLEFVRNEDLIIKIEKSVGKFIGKGATLVSVHCSNDSKIDFDEETIEEINNFFTINRYRTIEQDIGFGIRQIVDIAIKALSPGINDTTTAIVCIDYLGVITGEIANRKLPTSFKSGDGKLRVYIKDANFQKYIENAFDQIRINGKANLAIFLRLLKAIEFAAEQTTEKKRRAVLFEQINLIAEFAGKTLQTEYEKNKLNEKIFHIQTNISVE